MRRASLALLVAWLAGAALAPGRARGSDLLPRNQALLLLRILAYDRNLKVRAGPAVTVVVLYRAGDRVSEERRTALLNAFEEVSRDVVVAGLPVKVEAVPFRDGADLEARLEAARASLIYVDPALIRAVPEIAQAAARRSVLSADGSRGLVEAGLAIGVVAQEGKAGLLVNLKAARQGGADLDAALLGVSEIVREAPPRGAVDGTGPTGAP